MDFEHCYRALLTSIAGKHVHGRTNGLTEKPITLNSYLTLVNAHRGVAKNGV